MKKKWVDVLSKIGCVILGIFYLIMLVIIIMYVNKQMWGAVAISVGMSFVAFMISFCTVAVGMALEKIGDKIANMIL